MKMKYAAIVVLTSLFTNQSIAKEYKLDPAYEINKQLMAGAQAHEAQMEKYTGSPSSEWVELWRGSTQGAVPIVIPNTAVEVYIIANGRGFNIPANSHSTLIDGRGSYSGHVVRGARSTQTGHSGRCVHTSYWTSGGDNGRRHSSCDQWEHPGHTVPAVNIQSVQVKY